MEGYGAISCDYLVYDGSSAYHQRPFSVWMGDGPAINYLASESSSYEGSSAGARGVFQTICDGRLVKAVAWSDCTCYSELTEDYYYIYN